MSDCSRRSFRLSAALLCGSLGSAVFAAGPVTPNAPAAGAKPPIGSGPAAPALLPAEEECAAYGRSLAALFNNGKVEDMVRLLDQDAMANRILAGLNLSVAEARGVKTGVFRSTPTSLRSQFEGFESARFLRVQTIDGERRALVRFLSGEGAVNYVGFTCEGRAGGRMVWSDCYSYMSGEPISKSVRRLLLPLFTELNKGFLEKAIGTESAYAASLNTIRQISQLKQAGKTIEAWSACETLPDEVKRDRTILMLRLGLAQAIDDTKYLRVIGEWETTFPGDPTLDFISMDGDVLRKDYAGAIRHADAFAKRLGGDAYLDVLVANTLLTMERYDEARKRARAALAVEPNLTNAFDVLLGISQKTKNHAETVKIMEELRTNFPQMDLDAMVADKDYAEFRLSRAYLDWAAAQKKPPLSETPTP